MVRENNEQVLTRVKKPEYFLNKMVERKETGWEKIEQKELEQHWHIGPVSQQNTWPTKNDWSLQLALEMRYLMTNNLNNINELYWKLNLKSIIDMVGPHLSRWRGYIRNYILVEFHWSKWYQVLIGRKLKKWRWSRE